MNFIIIMVVLVLLLVIALPFRETYIKTLGDFGKPDPVYCSETEPRHGLCNACSVRCNANYTCNCLKCQNAMI